MLLLSIPFVPDRCHHLSSLDYVFLAVSTKRNISNGIYFFIVNSYHNFILKLTASFCSTCELMFIVCPYFFQNVCCLYSVLDRHLKSHVSYTLSPSPLLSLFALVGVLLDTMFPKSAIKLSSDWKLLSLPDALPLLKCPLVAAVMDGFGGDLDGCS